MWVRSNMIFDNGSPLKRGGKINWREFLGSTTFIEAKNLAPVVGCEKLFLKFEGGNPTGTQKDRISLAIVDAARNQGAKAVAAASCGNFGASLAWAARLVEIPAHIYIPEGYHVPKDRMKRIKDAGAELHYHPGQYEDAVEFASQEAQEKGWFDANPGTPGVREISLDAYGEIANEIYRDIRRAPNYVFCPVGNGTTLAGIYLGFKKLHDTGKIQTIPRMVATSTRRGNPIVKSFKLGSRTIKDLGRQEIKETKFNEPLTNWHAYDGQDALDAIYESRGFADYASEAKMWEFSKRLRQEEGLYVLPAAASTLAVMSDLADSKVTVKGSFTAILTGRDFE
ncbi:pyridoxal-phosphate dependent enzyme [Candidatus Thorarchaeota archaeon]|nr:MAG: pyridoxal-phosphate dependent enzyme [Candidatus Thorarchaeota archaeon]